MVELPRDIRGAFRPPENCNFCENVKEIEQVTNISPREFERKYAYSGVPVIVKDATVNWTALTVIKLQQFVKLINLFETGI